MSPKAFICHATEDKERFIRGLAKNLISNGIDVWLDEWEMLIGDSLVDRIFEEGIKSADVMIIVLSNNSVNKSWVKEEINAGFVKRLNGKIRLMPVIIDDCEIPECLKTTIWQRINDVNSYEKDFQKILSSILGFKNKPKIGNLPQYIETTVDLIGGLSEIDSLVFKVVCEIAIEKGIKMVHTSQTLDKCKEELEINNEQAMESLEILDEEYYIKLSRVIGGPPPVFIITDSGFEDYARSNISSYSIIYEKVAYHVANNPRTDSSKIAELLKQPTLIIENVLIHLNNRDMIKISKHNQGISVHHASVRLRRYLLSKE